MTHHTITHAHTITQSHAPTHSLPLSHIRAVHCTRRYYAATADERHDAVYALSPELYGEDRDERFVFHVRGSTWHEGDAALIMLVYVVLEQYRLRCGGAFVSTIFNSSGVVQLFVLVNVVSCALVVVVWCGLCGQDTVREPMWWFV